MENVMVFTYTNHRGETAERRVHPVSVWYGKSPYHQGAQWFLKAYDADRGTLRDFAMADMRGIVRG